jgi:putative two-component system response regulator
MAERFSKAIEYRVDPSGRHAMRVGALSGQIASAMSLAASEIELIRLAAPFHDVGNVALDDSILCKCGPLDPDEREFMKKHTLIGSELLGRGQSPVIQMAERIARTHHERWDGGGYPIGLKGREIPLAGRIVAVADVFDALTHDRPYKKCWAIDEAVFEIERLSGSHFDPAVVEAFKQVLIRQSESARVA